MKKLFLAVLIILILAPIILADNLTNNIIVLSKTEAGTNETENQTTNLNSENQIKVGDLVVNTSTYSVTRHGVVVKLSRKEYSLLEYLMRNAGIVLSKDKIIAHVWDYDSDILDNTVEVYIRNLRTKLGKPDFIQTLRGFGYKISPNT